MSCDVSRIPEVPVVNLTIVVINLNTLADLAIRGSARADADDVLAVFLEGGFVVLKLNRPRPSHSPCTQITVP
jgi:hypothetical protein